MSEARLSSDIKGAFAAGLAAAVVAALVNEETLAWFLAPAYVGGLLYAAIRAPLRHSLYVLTFCAFTLEKPTEMPLWGSPLFPLGSAMFLHLNHLTGWGFMILSGMECCIVVLALVALFRAATGSGLDRRTRVSTPEPLVKLAYVSLLGTSFTWLYGLATNGDFGKSLWQVEKVIYVPIVFLLCHYGLRGPKDHLAFGKVLLVAAALRAGLAVYIVQTVDAPIDPYTGESLLVHATSHHDSMLFASAFLLLVLLFLEGADRRLTYRLWLLFPLLFWGMIANNRRMVWVQVGLVLLTLYLATPPSPVKRKVKRVLLWLSPAIAAYIVVGWNASGPFFKPVQTARSVIEPETDASSLWREIENYDLLFTFRHAPILGHGYGHPFWEVIPLPPVGYDLEQYCPHNSILGLWAYAGYVGFTALILLWAGGVFFAMRAHAASRAPLNRVCAVLAMGSVIIYTIQCYGDMGLGAWTGVFLLAPSLALAGKLAVATGTWSTARHTARARNPAPRRPAVVS